MPPGLHGQKTHWLASQAGVGWGGNPAVTMTRMYVCPHVQIDTGPVGPDMSLLLHLLL